MKSYFSHHLATLCLYLSVSHVERNDPDGVPSNNISIGDIVVKDKRVHSVDFALVHKIGAIFLVQIHDWLAIRIRNELGGELGIGRDELFLDRKVVVNLTIYREKERRLLVANRLRARRDADDR